MPAAPGSPTDLQAGGAGDGAKDLADIGSPKLPMSGVDDRAKRCGRQLRRHRHRDGHDQDYAMSAQRRFPPPWSIVESNACFIVKDSDGQPLAYVYFENDPGALKCEAAHARRGIPYRCKHCQAAKRAAANTERHSEAAEHRQPRRLSASVNVRASEMN